MGKLLGIESVFNMFSDSLTKASLNAINILSQISSTIFSVRIQKEMKQKEFAKFLGVSQGMISKWESGEYNFTINQLCEVCEKLEITPSLELKPENELSVEYEPEKSDYLNWTGADEVHRGQAKIKKITLDENLLERLRGAA